MKKKNGFAFIETIVTIVILSAALIYLYSSYSAIITEEERRVYYDDTAFIYYTNYVRKFLEEYADLNTIKSNAFKETYITTIGAEYEGLFESNKSMMKESLEKIVQSFKINQIILVDSKMFDECFSNTEDKCDRSLENLGYNLKTYINTINDTSYEYYLVVEYASSINEDTKKLGKCTPGIDKKCNSYYASLGI